MTSVTHRGRTFRSALQHSIALLALVLGFSLASDARAQEVFIGTSKTSDQIDFSDIEAVDGGQTQLVFDVAGDGGYLSVFVAYDGTVDSNSERVVDDLAVAPGRHVLDLEIASSGATSAAVEVRVCLDAGECDDAGETEPAAPQDGEFEAGTITIGTTVSPIGVTIADIDENSTSGSFDFEGGLTAGLDADGLVVVTDGNGTLLFSGDVLALALIDFEADDLELDFTNGIPLPIAGTSSYAGNGVSSVLTLTQTGSAQVVNDITYTYETDQSGNITFDTRSMDYSGILPIYESLVAGNKVFEFPDVSNAALVAALTQQPEGKVIRLTPNGDTGGSGNGSSFIDCVLCGEETHFRNPTATLTIRANGGVDSVYVGRLDDVVPATFTTLNIEGGGAPTAGAPVGGKVLAHDYINVTPSTSYEINVDGGDPDPADVDACVSPDVLDLNVSGGTLTYTDFDDGEGTWTFANYGDVNFTDIEIQADQPYSVSVVATPELAYATDLTDIQVSVVNNGSHPVRCLQVDLPRALLAIGDGDPVEPAGLNTPYANYADIVITAGEDNGDYKEPDSFIDIDQFGAEIDLHAGAPDFGDYYDENLYPTNFAVEGAFLGVLEMGRGAATGYVLDPGHTLQVTWNDILVSNHLLMPETYDVRARLQTVETGNENIGGLRYAGGAVLAFDDVSFDKGFYFPAKTHVNTAVFLEKEVTAYGETATYEQLVVGVFQGAPGITGSVWCRVPLVIDGSAPGGATLWEPPAGTLGGDESLHWRPCSGTNIADDPTTPAVDESRIALPYPLHPNKLFMDLGADDAPGGTDEDQDILWLTTWGSAGLYKSLDYGQTWMAAWPGIGPGNASIGAYWTNVYTITRNSSNNFLYISANDGMLFHSLNRGRTWQQIGSLPNVDADTPWSMLSHPDGALDNVLYAGTFGRGVYVSTDYGFTWAPLTSAANVGEDDNENTDLVDAGAGHIFDMVMDEGGDYLIAGTGTGVWRVLIDQADGLIDDADVWEFIGVNVELEDGTIVTPEIRSLAIDYNTPADDTDDVLVAGAWGAFLSDNRRTVSAFEVTGPTAAAAVSPGDDPADDDFSDLALRGVAVNFITVSPSGDVLIGSSTGTLHNLGAMTSSTSTSSEIDPAEAVIPTSYALGQNYPNPFNPVTTIGFDLPATGHVRLAVYDVLGRQVALLVSGQVEAGQHQVRFDAHNLPSGSYLYRLDTAQGSFTRQLVLMK